VIRRAALLLIAASALAGCGGDETAKQEAASPAGAVKQLANVLDLRADFEADAGKPRLLLLFSPT